MNKKAVSLLKKASLFALIVPLIASCSTTLSGNSGSNNSIESGNGPSQDGGSNRDDASKYNVSITNRNGGSIAADKTKASVGELVTLNITLDDGYSLSGIIVNEETVGVDDLFEDDEGYLYQLNMIEGGLTIEGIFVQKGGINIIAKTGGSVTTDKERANKGEKVTVTINVNSGYSFDGIILNGATIPLSSLTKINNSKYTYEFNMGDEGVSIQGIFYKVENVTINSVTGGSIVSDKLEARVGEEIRLTVSSSTNYLFVGLKVNNVNYNEEDLVRNGSFYVLTMVSGGLTISGNFLRKDDGLIVSIPSYNPSDLLMAYEGESINLPNATIKDSDNNDYSSLATLVIRDLTDNDALIAGKEILSNVPGTHTIRYEAKINNEVYGYKDMSIVFARRLIRSGETIDPHWEANEFVDNDSQTVTLKDDGMAYLHLNVEESNYYYAEFSLTDQTWSGQIGFAHGNGLNVYSNYENMFKQLVEPSSKQIIKGYRNRDMWSNGYQEKHENLGSYDYYPFNSTALKFAVARVGTYFYTFINDKYESATQEDMYSDIPTKVAIFGNAYGASGNDITLSNFDLIKDETGVRNKVASLVGDYMVGPYVPNTGSWSYSSSDVVFGKNNTRGEYAEILNKNVGHNDAIVSPWITYKDEFTFEFDYKLTEVASDADDQEPRVWVELRPISYGDSLFEFGYKTKMKQFMLDPNSDDNIYSFFDGPAYYEGGRWDYQYNFSDTDKWGGSVFDDSQGIHFKLQRIFTDFELGDTVYPHTANYIMTATSIANPSQFVSRTIYSYGANFDGNDSTLVRPTITNRKSAGLIYNLQYTK